jgi:hypothetical protein
MANIPAALVVLQAHLVAAGGALTDPLLDVDRGVLATRGKQIRYYWSGEVEAPRMDRWTLSSELVGERFIVAAAWPLQDLSEELVTALDVEMQALAGQIRTRLDGDASLGGNIDNLVLGFGTPDITPIAGARHVVMEWELDLSYVEYSIVL